MKPRLTRIGTRLLRSNRVPKADESTAIKRSVMCRRRMLRAGVVFGTEYVGAGARAAYIATRTTVDGGWVVIGGQCR